MAAPTGAVFRTALGAIKAVLVDSKGKTLGVPVFELLDGKYRDRVEFNTDWGAVMAASMAMTVPIALLSCSSRIFSSTG